MDTDTLGDEVELVNLELDTLFLWSGREYRVKVHHPCGSIETWDGSIWGPDTLVTPAYEEYE